MNILRLNKFGILVITLLFLFICSTVFLYIKYNNLRNFENTTKNIESDLSILEKVSKIAIIPENEIPEMIIVKDLEEIKNEPFFKNAILGDSVLVFVKAKKAYLYRESENRIVDIAPILLNTEVDSN